MTRCALLAALLLAACAPERPASPEAPTLETPADSVAWRLAEGAGGLEAWEALPALRFSFGVEREGRPAITAHHLWDRRTNRYRVEWAAPNAPDSVYVALYSDWPRAGEVYLNGRRVDSVGTGPALAAAERRTINDTYWLLAPLKAFDPGVTRTYAPDSADARHEVVRLSFDDVGLTPGDQYWLFADRQTGRLDRWTYLLQNAEAPRSFRWTGYQTLEGPAGPVHLATRKEPLAGGAAILTGDLSADPPDEALLSDPTPRWMGPRS
jgi:hypothetical protein